MKTIGGYAGSILFVDLTDRKVTMERLPQSLMSGFIGASGINLRLACELTNPKTDALAPGNALCFGAGPFVGTTVPGACRSSVAAKSPAAGFMATSGSGDFGFLKFAGIDHIVITGKSERPVYLKIFDDDVEIRDAAHIWGKDTWEATDAIQAAHGREFVVQCIGPAGENLVRDAAIVCRKFATTARGGWGAIMGSKNLKAIAVGGTRGIKVAQPQKYSESLSRVYRIVREVLTLPQLHNRRMYGSVMALESLARNGWMPYRNWADTASGDNVARDFNPQAFAGTFKGGDIACLSCPIGCKHLVRITEGKYKGLNMPISCGATATIYLGTNNGLTDWPDVWRSQEMCNRLGLDIISTGSVVSFAIELYQKGIITDEDTDGLKLEWGNPEVVHTLIQQIAYRLGIGRILAEGLGGAPGLIGKDAEACAVQSKGIGPVFDARVKLSPETMEQSVGLRGQPAVSGSFAYPAGGQFADFCRRIKLPEDGIEAVISDYEANMGRLASRVRDYAFAMDSLGLCTHLSMRGANVDIPVDLWAELYSALTGIPMTAGGLLQASRNAYDLARDFNMKAGGSRKNDAPAPRCFAEPLRIGDRVRQPLDRGYFDRMVTQYYQDRGWDPETGMVPPDRIAALTRQTVRVDKP